MVVRNCLQILKLLDLQLKIVSKADKASHKQGQSRKTRKPSDFEAALTANAGTKSMEQAH